MSDSAVSRYENGERIPDIYTVMAFADFFGVTTDYLCGRKKNF